MGQNKRKGQPQANGGGDDADVSTNKKMMKKDKVDLLQQLEKNESLPADVELEINPFLLHPVLKVMMSQMTIEDLKKARGVSTLWDHTASLELQKLTSQMKDQNFEKADKIKKFTKSLEDSPNKVLLSPKMRSTLKVFCAQRRRFFQNFEPKSITIDIESGDTNLNSQMLKILQFNSEHIKKFHINGSLLHRQNGRKTQWPKILKFPQLEEISLLYKFFDNNEIKDLHFIENVAKKAPNLKSLKLYNLSINLPVCGLLTSIGLIEKLEDFAVCYGVGGHPDVGDFVFAQDLLDMALGGLKLTKFKISVAILGHLDNQVVILGLLDKLKKFFISQSVTLVNLDILLGLFALDDFDTCKFDMPPLPKLKVLEIGIGKICSKTSYWISFTKPLPEIFPNLREIIIDLKFDTNIIHDLGEILLGSLDTVKIMRIKYSNPQNFKNYGICRLLETHFPYVVELEMDHLENFNYKNIQWKSTLKKLTLHPPKLEMLNLGTLSQLKELERLELINKGQRPIMCSTLGKYAKFEFGSLSETSVKSLKIQNYLIDEKVVEEIRSRYVLILDYIPPRLDLQ